MERATTSASLRAGTTAVTDGQAGGGGGGGPGGAPPPPPPPFFYFNSPMTPAVRTTVANSSARSLSAAA